ncbi:MAG: DUF87 domain-containing protein [Campylobacterota bacterium]|nr:DUF87 domain-containing protein [Campylobacterota bacterium]
MTNIYEKMGLFYLGKNSLDDELTLYKSKHLTTHAAIIGMTGSGKTGLGIGLIEEAAVDNIPAIIIDPKGDMGNLCLSFPSMQGSDFEPWMDASEAANKNKTLSQLANDTASMWNKGIKSFGQDSARVQKLANVEKTIYTPGSSAGVGVNILGNFDVPSDAVLDDADTFSSLINTTVSSLLSLVSIEADPVSSKEHLLLSNIFYHYWSQGVGLSLEDLIGYVATPPFSKIGILQLKSFYPQKDRMKLAMLFNNVISSVTFSSWIKGEALDIQNMMYDENGKAKISIFSIAHLNDNERMFFVTILLNAYISWMRRQRGSTTLKALLYMDEIFGFFPPTSNPPSKQPMLLLLKQARAFGTGVILSTQNPVDIDYKGLSNIGTWFIGKLQTKQDIAKVLDGIAAKSDLSKKELATQIATLKGRHFFLKNVHTDKTNSFYTRWVMSYLKGPMTKDDIRMLMKNKKENIKEQDVAQSDKSSSNGNAKPLLNEGIKQYYNDTNINAKTPFYPYLYAHAQLRFYNQRKGIDTLEDLYFKVELDEMQNTLSWEDAYEEELLNINTKSSANATYCALPTFISQERTLKVFDKKLSNHLYGTKRLELFACKKLKMESTINQSKRDFMVEIEDVLKDKQDIAIEKLEKKYQTKYERFENKAKRLEIKLQKEKTDVSSKTTDTVIGIGMTVLGALFGRKAFSSSTISKGASALKKGKSVLKERNDVKNTESLIADLQEDVEQLGLDLEEQIEKVEQNFQIDNFKIESVMIKPRRSDISIHDSALLWER